MRIEAALQYGLSDYTQSNECVRIDGEKERRGVVLDNTERIEKAVLPENEKNQSSNPG